MKNNEGGLKLSPATQLSWKFVFATLTIAILAGAPDHCCAASSNIELVDQHGGWNMAVAKNATHVFAGFGPNFTVVEGTNFTTPTLLAEIQLARNISAIALTTSTAYVGDNRKALHVIDITSPTAPLKTMEVDVGGSVVDLAITSYCLQVATPSGLDVYRINAGTTPTLVRSFTFPGQTTAVDTSGSLAFVTVSRSLHIVDVSDPTSPALRGTYVGDEMMWSVTAADNLVVVADGSSSLNIIDVGNPDSPTLLKRHAIGDTPLSLELRDNLLYTAGYLGLRIFDLTDLQAPVEIGRTDLPWQSPAMVVDANHAWVAGANWGLGVFDIADPMLPAEMERIDPPVSFDDLAITGTVGYFTDGQRVRIMEIMSPHHLVARGQVIEGAITAVTAYSEDVMLFTEFALDTLRIYDTSDRDHPVEIGRVDLPNYPIELEVSGDQAYVSGINYFAVIDLSDLEHPTIVAQTSVTGYAPDLAVSGNYAFVSNYAGGVRVLGLDGTPSQRGQIKPNGYSVGVAVIANVLFVADEIKGMLIFDVIDPMKPVQIANFPGSFLGVTVKDGLAYLSGKEGLSVLDVSNPRAPVERGFYNFPDGTEECIVIDGLVYSEAFGTGGLYVLRYTGPPAIIKPTPISGRLGIYVQVTERSIDISGSPVQYRYRWTSSGGDIVNHGPTTSTIDFLTEMHRVDPGEIWTVEVTPTSVHGSAASIVRRVLIGELDVNGVPQWTWYP